MHHPTAARINPAPRTAMTSVRDMSDVALRQLRHQTKNALQRIIAQIAASEVRATEAGDALADDLERRICLSARVSDALFGFTEQPAPLPERLTSLAQATVALLSGSEQAISIDVQAAGSCEPGLASIVVQIAYEMLCNAVKHGMHMRLGGHIGVRLLVQASGRVILQVRDDGWAPEAEPFEEVLSIMQALAAAHGGRVSMSRVDDWNVARLELPGHYRPG